MNTPPARPADRFAERRRAVALTGIATAINALNDANLVLPHGGAAKTSVASALLILHAAEKQATEELS